MSSIKSSELASAYVEYGKAAGYFWAELLLMKYLPKSKPDGKCYDVPPRKRAAFLAELKEKTAAAKGQSS
jgi:hypothetical protein